MAESKDSKLMYLSAVGSIVTNNNISKQDHYYNALKSYEGTFGGDKLVQTLFGSKDSKGLQKAYSDISSWYDQQNATKTTQQNAAKTTQTTAVKPESTTRNNSILTGANGDSSTTSVRRRRLFGSFLTGDE